MGEEFAGHFRIATFSRDHQRRFRFRARPAVDVGSGGEEEFHGAVFPFLPGMELGIGPGAVIQVVHFARRRRGSD